MPYTIDWEMPQAVLYLRLIGDMTLEEFVEINQSIMDYLHDLYEGDEVALIVDVTGTHSVPRAFESLKASQKYANASDSALKWILVVGSDKLMRLMMLLTFNLCRPRLQFFNDIDTTINFLTAVR